MGRLCLYAGQLCVQVCIVLRYIWWVGLCGAGHVMVWDVWIWEVWLPGEAIVGLVVFCICVLGWPGVAAQGR